MRMIQSPDDMINLPKLMRGGGDWSFPGMELALNQGGNR